MPICRRQGAKSASMAPLTTPSPALRNGTVMTPVTLRISRGRDPAAAPTRAPAPRLPVSKKQLMTAAAPTSSFRSPAGTPHRPPATRQPPPHPPPTPHHPPPTPPPHPPPPRSPPPPHPPAGAPHDAAGLPHPTLGSAKPAAWHDADRTDGGHGAGPADRAGRRRGLAVCA